MLFGGRCCCYWWWRLVVVVAATFCCWLSCPPTAAAAASPAAAAAAPTHGHCVLYDECGPKVGILIKSKSRCPYSGAAKPLNDSGAAYMLAELCPILFDSADDSTWKDVPLCCTPEVVQSLSYSVASLETIVGSCEPCYVNLMMSICAMTCSPVQSTFLQVNQIAADDELGDHVTNLTYRLTQSYADNMFQSCRGVQFGNAPAYKTLCGESCDGPSLLRKLAAYSPFGINYVFTDGAVGNDSNNNSSALHLETVACNENKFYPSRSENISACSCSNCLQSCPVSPEYATAPEPLSHAVSLLISATLFAVLVLTIAVLLVAHHRRAKRCVRISDGAAAAAGHVNDQLPDSLSCREQLGAQVQLKMMTVFSWWGYVCASWPVTVLLVGVAFAAFCSVGVVYLRVTTDPVQLWAAPSSRSRLEKSYFDSSFQPFYRIEMLIIRPKQNTTPFNASTDDDQLEFGPVFRKQFLQEVFKLERFIIDNLTATMAAGGETVRLVDICFRPLYPQHSECAIQSVTEYFQRNVSNLDLVGSYDYTYAAHLHRCLQNPTEMADTNYKQLPCLASWGGPVEPYTALGGFLPPAAAPAAPADGDLSEPAVEGAAGRPLYRNSTALVTTFLVNNHQDQQLRARAEAWEKQFLHYLRNYNSSLLDIAYSAERSISDEIERVSHADLYVVIVSYTLMFVYISLSLGSYSASSCSRFPVACKLTLGLGGVLIVLLSVTASIGVYGFIGVAGTLIVIEVIPFLVLAVGADNIFFLVHAYRRVSRHHSAIGGATVPECMAMVVGEVAPSMLISSLTDSICFFLGALTPMPAVRAFALFAGLALLFDFLLQITCFVALMTLDARREKAGRCDVLYCLRLANPTKSPANRDPATSVTATATASAHAINAAPNGGGGDGLGDQERSGLAHRLSTLLLRPVTCGVVLVAFAALTCANIAVLPRLQVGLDAELSMPVDSYVLKYLEYQKRYMSVGPPVYFVTRGSLNYTDRTAVQSLCSSSEQCDDYSLTNQLVFAAKQPQITYIASTAMSWVDDYLSWSSSSRRSCCSEIRANHTWCPSHLLDQPKYSGCVSCSFGQSVLADKNRGSAQAMRRYLPIFLQENPSASCPKAGHAAFANAVKLSGSGDVIASHFMTYHSILRTSQDFTDALRWSRRLADNMTTTLRRRLAVDNSSDIEVFSYSSFYVFFEQYLHTWHDLAVSLGLSLLVILAVTFVLLGCDLCAALLVTGTIVLILVNVGGLMYWWNIPLNAVSLVNLVMAVGISVEFCSHLVRAYTMSLLPTRRQRTHHALVTMGASIFGGITLTKFCGIIVLAFANSQIFQVFYFRMYLAIVLFGACHGLILLPVLLTYLGPPVNRAYQQLVQSHVRVTRSCQGHDNPLAAQQMALESST